MAFLAMEIGNHDVLLALWVPVQIKNNRLDYTIGRSEANLTQNLSCHQQLFHQR